MLNDVFWSAMLDFTLLLKGQEITEIKAESSQMLMKYTNSRISEHFMKKTGKRYRIMSKKLIFGQAYMKFAVAMQRQK